MVSSVRHGCPPLRTCSVRLEPSDVLGVRSEVLYLASPSILAGEAAAIQTPKEAKLCKDIPLVIPLANWTSTNQFSPSDIMNGPSIFLGRSLVSLDYTTCLYLSQKVPMYVATKMASIKQASLFVPSPETYARTAVRYIGYEPRCTPYWPHALLWFLFSVVPESLVDGYVLGMSLGIRKMGRAKEARKKAV
ncbi:Estradiol 17-beta-dehydrogenase 12-A [Hordeum vulgare]|nr:Estradiol 17-beta-dehydrogenase 12-A [Hordeum vulgare]